jgi:hypothetical protein
MRLFIKILYMFFVLVAFSEFKASIVIGQDKQQSIYVVADPSTSDANLIKASRRLLNCLG